jgi:hypothetical protein
MMFIAAIALICSTALPRGTCIVSNAEQVYYASVPQPYCDPAMQQLVAYRTRARPLNLAIEYIQVICKNGTPARGLSVDDVGQVAPPQIHIFTPEEARDLNNR